MLIATNQCSFICKNLIPADCVNLRVDKANRMKVLDICWSFVFLYCRKVRLTLSLQYSWFAFRPAGEILVFCHLHLLVETGDIFYMWYLHVFIFYLIFICRQVTFSWVISLYTCIHSVIIHSIFIFIMIMTSIGNFLLDKISHVMQKPAYAIFEQQAQISLRICAVWSAPLFFIAWIVLYLFLLYPKFQAFS